MDKQKRDCLKDGKYSREDLRIFDDVSRAVGQIVWTPPSLQEVEHMKINGNE